MAQVHAVSVYLTGGATLHIPGFIGVDGVEPVGDWGAMVAFVRYDLDNRSDIYEVSISNYGYSNGPVPAGAGVHDIGPVAFGTGSMFHVYYTASLLP